MSEPLDKFFEEVLGMRVADWPEEFELFTALIERKEIEAQVDVLFGLRNKEFDSAYTPAQILMSIDNQIRQLEIELNQLADKGSK